MLQKPNEGVIAFDFMHCNRLDVSIYFEEPSGESVSIQRNSISLEILKLLI